MNIVLLSGGEIWRGGFFLDLAQHLVQAGHKVIVLHRKESKTEPSVEDVSGITVIKLKTMRFDSSLLRRIARFTTLPLHASLILNEAIYALSAEKYLAKNIANIDVIQTFSTGTGFILSVIGKEELRNRLFHISGSTRRLSDKIGLYDRFAIGLENSLAMRAKRIIFVDKGARERFIRATRVNPEKAVFIPTAIDMDFFNPKLDVADVKQKYSLNGKFVILFVGTIHPRKGVEYLIKAANIVVNERGHKEALFLLVGPVEGFGLREVVGTPYFAKIKRLINSYNLQGNVKLTGYIPRAELAKLYVASQIFVLPTLAEATPVVIKEAMACGKPVISTKVDGIPLLVRDSQNGFLVEPENEKQLAEKIIYFIDNPAEVGRMGSQARIFAEQEFGWEKILEKLRQVYERQ